MVNAQEWLDKNYPINSTCQLEVDSENLGKLRKDITELDISEQNLEGELKLVGFDNLWNFSCDNNQLTLLDCSQITSITTLNCNNNPDLKEIKASQVESGYVSLDMEIPGGISLEVKETNQWKKLTNYQQLIIKGYFKLLLQKFLKDRGDVDIKLSFEESSDETRKIGGRTRWGKAGEKTIIEVRFLNYYDDDELLREAVCHEFTHAHFYTNGTTHTHDDNFYSQMEKFEDWLDENQNLTPRQDKSNDRSQHDCFKQLKCPKCGKKQGMFTTTGGKCFECHDVNQKVNQRIKEFNHLINLMEDSQTLIELENNYQLIRNHYLYEEKGNIEIGGNGKLFDCCYSENKQRLQSKQSELENENQRLKVEIEVLKKQIEELKAQSQVGVLPK